MSDDSNINLPPVSVIVPVYNSSERVADLLDSLLSQDYPKELYEVIVVDNGSTDDTVIAVEKYPFVTLLHETETQSSYAARNTGIRAAKHKLLAFTDADCIASRQWLRQGVETLIKEDADLVGGNIEFTLSQKPTNAELYDSITYLNTKASVEQDSSAATANLFTKLEVFEKTELFPEVRSGGDYLWTTNAVKNGFKIAYGPQATVKHPARGLGELLGKCLRIGTGNAHRRFKEGHTLAHEIPYTVWNMIFTGVPIAYVDNNIETRGNELIKNKRTSMLFMSYLCRLSSRLGSLTETLKILFGIVKPK